MSPARRARDNQELVLTFGSQASPMNYRGRRHSYSRFASSEKRPQATEAEDYVMRMKEFSPVPVPRKGKSLVQFFVHRRPGSQCAMSSTHNGKSQPEEEWRLTTQPCHNEQSTQNALSHGEYGGEEDDSRFR